MTWGRPGPAPAWLALGVGFAVVALLAADRLALIPAHLSFNPNEGWNAFQSARALGAGPLYPPPQALTGDNYPPLSFYLVGWAGRLVGDPIVAGRLVALASLLATAGCVFAVARRLEAGAPAAAAGALLLLAYAATQYRAYLAMDDPQWLAHALMSAGLLALLPGRPGAAPRTGAVVGAALLMVGGGLVKHNLVAFPLAATLWLAVRHPRRLAPWLATAAGALALAGLACAAAYGSAVFADVLGGDRRYSWVRMASKSALPLLAMAPLAVVAAGLLARRRADPRLDLLLFAVALGVPLGVLQRSGEGVNVNAHFEGLIALCMAAGVALGWPEGERLRWLAPALLLLPFVALAPIAGAAEARAFAGRARAQAAWSAMQHRIAATPGVVACQTPALCYWAGEPFALDVFLYGQRVLRRGDASALTAAMAAHRFAAFELDAPAAERARRGDVANPVIALIQARTAPAFTAADGRRLRVAPR